MFEILKNTRVLILNKENEKLKESCEKNNIIFNRLTKDDIFSDNGLKELCRKLPTKESELNINIIFGVSEKNLIKYGKNFLANIIQFIIENNIKEKKIDDEDKNRIEIQNLSLGLEKKEDFKNNEDFNFSDLELFQFNEEEFNNNNNNSNNKKNINESEFIDNIIEEHSKEKENKNSNHNKNKTNNNDIKFEKKNKNKIDNKKNNIINDVNINNNDKNDYISDEDFIELDSLDMLEYNTRNLPKNNSNNKYNNSDYKNNNNNIPNLNLNNLRLSTIEKIKPKKDSINNIYECSNNLLNIPNPFEISNKKNNNSNNKNLLNIKFDFSNDYDMKNIFLNEIKEEEDNENNNKNYDDFLKDAKEVAENNKNNFEMEVKSKKECKYNSKQEYFKRKWLINRFNNGKKKK